MYSVPLQKWFFPIIWKCWSSDQIDITSSLFCSFSFAAVAPEAQASGAAPLFKWSLLRQRGGHFCHCQCLPADLEADQRWALSSVSL